MCKAVLFIIILTAFDLKANSQITKEDWMVGGNASFSAARQRGILNADVTNILISPDIGYFILDKLAVGMNAEYAYYYITTEGTSTGKNQISGGPFLRYYFLQPENLLNIFAQGSYQYVYYWSGNNNQGNQSVVTITGGASVFLNSNVGLEFMAGYQLLSAPKLNTSALFSLGIGFQIYIEKE